MSAPSIVCETSNATVASICCAQIGVAVTMGSTTQAVQTQSMAPSINMTLTACEWTPSSNSTAVSEIQSWLSCTDQYVNTTIGTVCEIPAATSAAHSAKLEGPAKAISMMMLVGVIVQMVLAGQ